MFQSMWPWEAVLNLKSISFFVKSNLNLCMILVCAWISQHTKMSLCHYSVVRLPRISHDRSEKQTSKLILFDQRSKSMQIVVRQFRSVGTHCSGHILWYAGVHQKPHELNQFNHILNKIVINGPHCQMFALFHPVCSAFVWCVRTRTQILLI